jgi:hypothetical protein
METAIVARFLIDHRADGSLLDRLIYRPSSCYGICGNDGTRRCVTRRRTTVRGFRHAQPFTSAADRQRRDARPRCLPRVRAADHVRPVP